LNVEMVFPLDLAHRPWRHRLGTAAIFFANGVGIGGWAAVIPKIKAMLLLSDAELALAFFAMAAGAIMFMPLAGILAPFLGGTGRALRYTSVGFGISLCLPGFASNLPVLVALTFVLGASHGMMEVPMNTHATIVERGWGVAIMSSFHAAWSCGGLAGAALGGLLIHVGTSTSLLLAAVGAFVLLVVLIAARETGIGEQMRRTGVHFIWPERRLLGLCLIALLGLLAEGAMADWSAVYLTSVIGLTPVSAVTGYVVYAFAMLVGRGSGDLIVRSQGRPQVIMLGAALAAAGICLAVATTLPVVALCGFGLIGLGLSNMVPAVFSTSAAISSSPALGISATATVGYGGFLLGPAVIGAIASLTGLRSSFLLLIVAMLAIIPLAAGYRKSKGENSLV
jgi:MFS family permease